MLVLIHVNLNSPVLLFFTPNIIFRAIGRKNQFTLVFLLLLLEIQASFSILALHIISTIGRHKIIADSNTRDVQERHIEVQEVLKLGKIPSLIQYMN